jgi:hypothetical protein
VVFYVFFEFVSKIIKSTHRGRSKVINKSKIAKIDVTQCNFDYFPSIKTK